MKDLLKKLMKGLLWIWQLPQHLIAMIIYIVNIGKVSKHKIDGITFYLAKNVFNCGVSLGNYIFMDLDTFRYYPSDTIKHEYGHSRQSMYLGWLYLIIIGLPSIIGNIVDRILTKINPKHKDNCRYYDQPWERWADKLGGVDRKTNRKLKQL